jgi:hypothetical protein
MFSHVITLLLVLLPSGPPGSAHANASGNLSVTAIVTSSASVSFDSQGRPVVMVANAPADADSIVQASTQFERTSSNPEKKPFPAAVRATRNKRKGVEHASAR